MRPQIQNSTLALKFKPKKEGNLRITTDDTKNPLARGREEEEGRKPRRYTKSTKGKNFLSPFVSFVLLVVKFFSNLFGIGNR
jgi:hypothetical protein